MSYPTDISLAVTYNKLVRGDREFYWDDCEILELVALGIIDAERCYRNHDVSWAGWKVTRFEPIDPMLLDEYRQMRDFTFEGNVIDYYISIEKSLSLIRQIIKSRMEKAR